MRRIKKVILFVIHAQVQSSARNDAARTLTWDLGGNRERPWLTECKGYAKDLRAAHDE